MNLIHVGGSLTEKESFLPLAGTLYAIGEVDGAA